MIKHIKIRISATFHVECYFRDFPLVPLQNCQRLSCGGMIKTRRAIRAGRHESWSARVKLDIQHLIHVGLFSIDTFGGAYIPHATRVIDRSRHAKIARVVKLDRGNFGQVSSEDPHALAWSKIPQPALVIERSGDQKIAHGVEGKGHYLSSVALQGRDLLSGLDIPHLYLRILISYVNFTLVFFNSFF